MILWKIQIHFETLQNDLKQKRSIINLLLKIISACRENEVEHASKAKMSWIMTITPGNLDTFLGVTTMWYEFF
jgi:hypothetical protein